MTCRNSYSENQPMVAVVDLLRVDGIHPCFIGDQSFALGVSGQLGVYANILVFEKRN